MKRNFSADHPDQLWVADFTYIQTNSGWVYTAFIIDVFSRAIVGWKVSTRMNTDMVLDALEQALHARNMPKNVIHHMRSTAPQEAYSIFIFVIPIV